MAETTPSSQAPWLLVDFGASRVKSAVWSPAQQSLLAVRECPAPTPHFGAGGKVEIDPEAYWSALEQTAGQLAEAFPEVEALWICAEMHGIVVADQCGNPLTPYISWRDERSIHPLGTAPSTLDMLLPQQEAFLAATGMRLCPGLPWVSLAHLEREGQLPQAFRCFTLVDWLLWRGGERTPGIHVSLAAGTGMFDIQQGDWSRALAASIGLADRVIHYPRIVPSGESLGAVSLAGRSLNVFGGVGDMQAAVHGAGFPQRAPLIVNLGTGSQVLGLSRVVGGKVGQRLLAGGQCAAAITHIPSGRALNVFAGMMDDWACLSGGQPTFWSAFSALTVDEVLEARLQVDPNVFEAAWQYRSGGAVTGIQEGRFSAKDFLAGLARGWLAQYGQALDMIDPDHEQAHFLLAGGLSRRANFILPVLEKLSGRRGQMAESITGEETLDGLQAMATMARNGVAVP